ncbi:MAG: helix-turn-helix domain-containing protein [Candidatus Bathyarchaeia archaeon]
MKAKERSIWEVLEAGFGGGTKFRVLTHLVLNSEEALTKYALAKATGLKTSSVENHLRTLLELGWIKEYPFTPKTYQINLENEVVLHIADFFQRAKRLKSKV